jgi:hypothetical protein
MTVIPIALWFVLGAGVGGLSFRSLEWTVARLNSAKGGAAWIVPGMVMRWAGAALLLILALGADWRAGLGAAAGYILAGRLMLARGIGRQY